MDICIDFDGTCVKYEFPKVGDDVPGAVETLLELIKNGHNLILFTMRDGKELVHAVDWFGKNNIKLYGIQRNPTQDKWTTSPKAFGKLYIDDAALGCPLIWLPEDERPYVDWNAVKRYLINRKLIKVV